MSLQCAKENFHFDKVLVTCDEDNFASARVIEKNGGIWENALETIDDDGRKIEKEILDKLFITDCRKVNHSEERFWLKLPVYAHLATAARANTPHIKDMLRSAALQV